MKIKLICLFATVTIAYTARAQVKNVADFFGSGTDNAELLFEKYLAPWTNAFGANMNSGWYNTVKPHKSLGFDLTVSFSGSLVPTSDRTFDMSTLNLQNITFGPNGSQTATVAGKRNGGQTMIYTPLAAYPDQNAEFESPGGVGVNIMPTPMLKLGIGIYKETEIDIRYIPTFSLGKFGEMGLWGVGIKHSLKQWIPVISKIPVLQLAIQGGYTDFKTKFDISVTPDSYGLSGTGDYENQQISLEVKSFTANILVGADLPIVDFYGGIGFATTNANLKLAGYYPIPTMEGTQITTVQSEKDPINAKITNSDGSKTKPRLNAGMRLKLGILTLHADYTYAKYSVVTAGIGISFR